jgi:hypothetical protein
MIHYAFMDGSGVYVRQAGDAKSVPSGAVEAPYRSDRLIGMMLVEGVFQDRPRIAEPVVEGGNVVFSDLPAGTTATVEDLETNEVLATLTETAGAITIELVDAGAYHIQLTPPLPWLPHRLRVTL